MRIERVEFKNINSLSGNWTINFADSELASGGIFLITGATGAGKSTILDAICLALYGRTPRQSAPGLKEDAIMNSLEEKECSATVYFEAGGKHYQAEWSHSRNSSKREAADPFCQPKYRFCEVDHPETIINKKGEFEKKIIETTGMSFDQFTRCVLLAQGKFSEFLRAKEGDRAELLEEITGGKIYPDISMAIFEEAKAHKNHLDELNLKLDAIPELSQEMEAEYEASIAAENQKAKEAVEKGNKATARIKELEATIAAQRSLREAEKAQLAYEEEAKAFRSDTLRLERKEKASLLEPQYKQWTGQRKEIADQERKQSQDQKSLEDEQGKKQEAEAALAKAKDAQQEAKDEREKQRPLIDEVKALDITLQELGETKEKTEKARQAAQKELSSLEDAIRKAEKNYDKLEIDLVEKKAQEAKFAGYEYLEHELESFTKTVENFTAAGQDYQRLEKETSVAEKNLNNASSERTKAESKQGKAELACQKAEKEAQNAEAALDAVLQGRLRHDLEQEKEHCTQTESLIQQCKESYERYSASAKELEGQRASYTKSSEELASIEQAVAQIQGACEAHHKEIETLEEQNQKAQLIASLEEHRAHLRHGEPCPCCGALEHPYVGEGAALPRVTETATRLKEAKKQEKKLQDKQTKLTNTQGQLVGVCNQLKESIERQSQNCTSLCAHAEELRQKLALEHKLPALEKAEGYTQELERLQAEYTEKRKGLEKLLKDIASCEQSLTQLNAAWKKANTAKEKADKALSVARDAYNENQRVYEQCQMRLDHKKSEYKSLEQQIQDALGRMQLTELQGQPPASLPGEIAKRVETWKKFRQEKEELEAKLTELKEKLRILKTKQASSSDNLEKKASDAQEAKDRYESYANKRTRLFGTKDTKAETERLEKAVSLAETKCQKAEKICTTCATQISSLESRLTLLASQLAKAKEKLEESREAFFTALQEKGFANEQDFQESLALSVQEERRIREKAGTLEKQRQDCAVKLEAARQNLKPDALSIEEARRQQASDQEVYRQADQARNAALQEIGRLRNELESKKQNQTDREDLVKERDAQKETAELWERLNKLIGSRDGKLFRVFAQRITLRRLLSYANRELATLSERYQLYLKEGSLDFEVQDAYQGNIRRSTTNLSGGESFLVSLALALGLVSFTSCKVEINTMFLDEGFGSLDPQALESAMNTLGNVCGNNPNKLIGIISHVEALKERIPTQINVVKAQDGRSSICGPGCSGGSKEARAQPKKTGRKRSSRQMSQGTLL